MLLEAANNPEFPPPFLTPMYRLGVNEGTLRVVELDLCAAHGVNDGVLRAAAVAALADPKPARSSSGGSGSSSRSGSGGGSVIIPSTPASATGTPPQTSPVDGKSRAPAPYPSNSSSSSSAPAAPSPFSSPPERWAMFYFPYIADTAELNWEAPCRVESRDDLVRAYLHAVETTTDVLVPLSVNGYQHHPLVCGEKTRRFV